MFENRPTDPNADNWIRLIQTHDATGAPAHAEFVQVVKHITVNSLASDAMLFMAPLHPEQTETPGVFRYTDPQRGSGWMRLEGWGRYGAEQVQELVRMEEITREVGPEPYKVPDFELVSALVVRSRNPWFLIGFGAVAIFFAVLIAVREWEGPAVWILYVLAGMLFLVGVGLVVMGSIRAPWWLRARRYAREHGGKLPASLKGL